MGNRYSIASEFDAFSVNYTEDMVNCVPYYLKLLSAFTENLPENFNPKKILDLGCGNGNVTAQLAQSFPKANFTLLDASQEMLELCKNRFQNLSVEYLTSYFEDFNFPDNTFDLIVAGFSIHHCNSSEKKVIFKKIYGSLTDSGIFGISDLMIDKKNPSHNQLIKDWKKFVLKNYPNEEKWEWLMGHYNEFDNPESLEKQTKWIKQAGFSKIEPFVYDSYWVYVSATK